MEYKCKWCSTIIKSDDALIFGTNIHKHLEKNHWKELVELGKKLRQQKKQDWTPSNDIDYFIEQDGTIYARKIF